MSLSAEQLKAALESRILLRKRNDVGSIPGGNTQMVWES